MRETKEVYRGGCPSCPGNEDILAKDTVLYNGFGGYRVVKDKKIFYIGGSDDKWENYKTLAQIEKMAKKSPKSKWKIVLDNPLRGATWERNNKGEWILTGTNLGFA